MYIIYNCKDITTSPLKDYFDTAMYIVYNCKDITMYGLDGDKP